jgi:hypothetical protein
MSPVAFDPPHHVIHEWEADSGYRWWTGPFLSAAASHEDYALQNSLGHSLSDTDCVYDCPACVIERASSRRTVLSGV